MEYMPTQRIVFFPAQKAVKVHLHKTPLLLL